MGGRQDIFFASQRPGAPARPNAAVWLYFDNVVDEIDDIPFAVWRVMTCNRSTCSCQDANVQVIKAIAHPAGHS